VMHAKGQMEVGDTLVAQSIIGSEFLGRIESETELGPLKAIRPTISGRAFITGRQQLTLDQDDPWPAGYRLSDTWPKLTNVR
jgi:proline racemase